MAKSLQTHLRHFFIGVLIYHLSLSSLQAQTSFFVPPLPEMSYAGVVDKSKFDGDRWSYMEAGTKNAPVIICMHGLGDSSVDWQYQLYDLSDTYHVIAWNAPGYMLSDGLKAETPKGKDFADALADFLNALKLDKVYLVGNSFGSLVAQSFAYYYPERVNKLVLLGAFASRKWPQALKMSQINFRKSQVADGGYAFANKRVEALLGPNPSSELVEVARKGMRGVHPKYFLNTCNGLMEAEDCLPAIIATKVTMPVLIIDGAEDKITPIAMHADVLKKELKNVRLEVLQGVGHLPHIEAYKEVNKLVRAFIN